MRILCSIFALSLAAAVGMMGAGGQAENGGTELRKKVLFELSKEIPSRPASFSSDGRFLATGGIHRVLIVWDLNSGKMVRKFEDESLRGGFSPRGTHLIIVNGANLELYAPPNFQQPASVISHPVRLADGITLFRLSYDERIICLTSYSGHDPNARNAYWLDFLSFPDGTPLKTNFLQGGHPGPVSLNRTGEAVAVRRDDRIEIWHWNEDALATVLEFGRVRRAPWAWISPRPAYFNYSADGRWMATTHPDGTLRLTDMEEPARAKIFRFDPEKRKGIPAFAADGSLMAVLMGGETERAQLFLYDLATESVLVRREGRFYQPSPLSISPDGRLVAVVEAVPYTLETEAGTSVERERAAVQVYELIRPGANPVQ